MKFFLVIILTFLLGGCWSSNAPADNSSNANLAKVPANAEVVKISNSNSKMIPYKSNISFEEAKAKQNANIKIIKRGNIEKTRVDGKPAPDNSTFKTRFDAKGFTATRTFIDHPTLKKVEKKQIGKETSLKAYLKDGKVYDVSEKKVPNFRVNSPDHILSAIGLGPKRKSTKGKNKEKIE